MSDLEKLKQMDPLEIQKRTYISPKVLRALINEKFDKLGSYAKVMGFLGILERELDLDLGELRQKADEYFGRERVEEVFSVLEKEESHDSGGIGSFVVKLVAVALLIVAAGVAWRYLLYPSQEPLSQPQNAQKNQFQNSPEPPREAPAQVTVAPVTKTGEENATSKKNATPPTTPERKSEENGTQPQPEASVQKSLVQKSLKDPTILIVPKRELWVGVIYLKSRKKRQFLGKEPIELNASSPMLIVTGHGDFKMEWSGEQREFEGNKRRYFLYEGAGLRELDPKNFKEYNRGRVW